MSILEKIHEMNGGKEPLPPSKIQRPVLLMLSNPGAQQERPAKKTEALAKAEQLLAPKPPAPKRTRPTTASTSLKATAKVIGFDTVWKEQQERFKQL